MSEVATKRGCCCALLNEPFKPRVWLYNWGASDRPVVVEECFLESACVNFVTHCHEQVFLGWLCLSAKCILTSRTYNDQKQISDVQWILGTFIWADTHLSCWGRYPQLPFRTMGRGRIMTVAETMIELVPKGICFSPNLWLLPSLKLT